MTTPETLDRLYPQLSKGRYCVCCGARQTEIHHIIPRAHKLLRWDLINLVPLCHECHQKVHANKKYLELFLPKSRFEYLDGLKNQNFKQYLLEHNLTAEDFYKLKEKDIKRKLK